MLLLLFYFCRILGIEIEFGLLVVGSTAYQAGFQINPVRSIKLLLKVPIGLNCVSTLRQVSNFG